jgi:hypothetical protein
VIGLGDDRSHDGGHGVLGALGDHRQAVLVGMAYMLVVAPHQSLGYLTPAEYATRWRTQHEARLS